jgi:hypothetical protein
MDVKDYCDKMMKELGQHDKQVEKSTPKGTKKGYNARFSTTQMNQNK